MLSAGVPLIFAGYLASSLPTAPSAALLLGFLLIVDAGLLAIAIARGPGASSRGRRSDDAGRARRVAGDVVCAGGGLAAGLVGTAGFVVLYLGSAATSALVRDDRSRAAARRACRSCRLTACCSSSRSWRRSSRRSSAAAAFDPAGARGAHCRRAAMESAGTLYYVAAFFAIATAGRLVGPLPHRSPAAGRGGDLHGLRARLSRPRLSSRDELADRSCRPGAAGLSCFASLVLLAFVSLGPVSPRRCGRWRCCWQSSTRGSSSRARPEGCRALSQIGSLLSWGSARPLVATRRRKCRQSCRRSSSCPV